LTLWKQLDLISRENKWLEIGAADPDELKNRAETILKECCPGPVSELTSVIYKDFEKTQAFIEGASEIEGTTLDVFKDYLRDHALRYAQLSSGEE